VDVRTIQMGDCAFEVLGEGDTFLGLGGISIGDTRVRSGRLPLRFYTQSFTGLELSHLKLLGVEEGGEEVRVRLRATFRPLAVKLMRDHSFDPVHDTGDWDAPRDAGEAEADLVLRPAADRFGGNDFAGFSYCWDYRSGDVPLFYILDQASWELDGDVVGATVISQSSCSAPVARFERDTEWTTEGVIHWEDANSAANTVMTHNLPRWASHQAFDFQCRDSRTLIGVFERVDLIRSVLRREAGRGELKTFDKHITAILINSIILSHTHLAVVESRHGCVLNRLEHSGIKVRFDFSKSSDYISIPKRCCYAPAGHVICF